MENPIISIEEAAQSTENTVFLDCRFSLLDYSLGQKLYNEAHIAGAYFMDMERDLSGKKSAHGGRHPIPNDSDFSNTISRTGVNAKSLIITYDDMRLAGAARCWWLLRYFGHKNVRVLNGGFKAWQAAQLPISAETPLPRDGAFIAQANNDMIVDMHYVARISRGEAPNSLIDSREVERYLGTEEPIDPVAGRIPRALNQPWQNITHEDGSVREQSEQKAIWEQFALNDPVLYCGSGVTAAVNSLSMVIAGYPLPKIYAGSFSDWCSYAINQIERG